MTELEKEVLDWTDAALAEALEAGGRKRVEELWTNWISFTARKKPSEKLAKQLEDFRKRLKALADNLVLETGPQGVVVKVTGDDESTWRMLERGTDWFDPATNVTEKTVDAVFG
jgi:hypothetical protein